ncbi:glycosyl hydrolase catalytic core-domain-containing protein [Flagelloscypha sp. PMI_526]|nr:glycosyl hydrolase catalytic core-domain-containing protein [Flagelloscypha sp. PMI_526]
MHLFTIIFLTTFVLPAYSFPSFPLRSAFSPSPRPQTREVTLDSKAGLTSPSPKAVESFMDPTNKVSWYYSWGPEPLDVKHANVNRTLEFVPMLWGTRQVEQFNNTIRTTISNENVTHILGMNEPQQTGQSNLTAQEGVDMWLTYIEPLKALGLRLGSPAPSSAPSGKTWTSDFLNLCAGRCSVDFIALHYYDVNATDFIDYMTSFHDAFQRPIWVTEWACQNFNHQDEQCSMGDISLFLNATQTWMDDTSWIERYSFFGAGFDNLQGVNQDNAMLDSNDELTALGKQYVGLGMASTNGSGNADGPPSGGKGSKKSSSAENRATVTFDAPNVAFLLGLGFGIVGAGVL